MYRVEKTVFLSYRRTNASWALAIFQNLRANGFDVFFDFSGIASGDFERVILENIKARAHFLLVLTPSALERCSAPGDWLRREIEAAMETRRNIVPLMLEDFNFDDPSNTIYLTGKLAGLKQYNGLRVPVDFFEEAMTRLRDKYLNVPLDAVVHPASGYAQQIAKEQQFAAATATSVQQTELTAEEWFEKGFNAVDLYEKLRCYSHAIHLKPDHVYAYYNRGNVRYDKKDLDGAIADYTEAIHLKPDYADAYNNRGLARDYKKDLDGAIADYTEAIRLKPDYAIAYYNRGFDRRAKGDLDGMIADYNEAIRLKPDDGEAYNNRGVARYDKKDLDGAIADYTEAIRLKPDDAEAYNNRGAARYDKKDRDGAIADFNEAIRLKPDHADAYNKRGVARYDKKDLDGAIADFNEAIRLEPDYAIAYTNRALAISRQNKG